MLAETRFLGRDEITEERTPTELASWVDMTFDRLWASAETTNWLRLRQGLADQFLGEIYPLSIFVNRLYSGRPFISCIPVIGNQSFDARILDHSTQPPSETKVEITCASIGYDDRLRMEYLTEHGGVCLTGDVKRIGAKGKGRSVRVIPKAIEHEEVMKKQFLQIRECVQKKLSKNYEGQPVLIISFDDSRGFYTEQDNDFQSLSDYINVELAPLPLHEKFCSVYILGLSRRVLLPVILDTMI